MNKFFAASMALAVALTAGNAMAEGDAKKGEKVFKKCKACHKLDKHATGPKLGGVFGRAAGTAEGYDKYSDALKASGITWNEETLAQWLNKKTKGPKGMVKGTKMAFAGLKKEKDINNLIAYLKEHGED